MAYGFSQSSDTGKLLKARPNDARFSGVDSKIARKVDVSASVAGLTSERAMYDPPNSSMLVMTVPLSSVCNRMYAPDRFSLLTV